MFLLRLATHWLAFRLERGEVQSPWPGIWRQAFEADPAPEMVVLARGWLRANPDHRAAPYIRERLLKFAALSESDVPASGV